MARHLYNAGVDVEVLLCGERTRVKGDALTNLRVIEKMGLAIFTIDNVEAAIVAEVIRQHVEKADVVVDALLGTGTQGAPRGVIRTAIEVLNALGKRVISLDIPSGLDCDTGRPLETAVRAEETITFAAMKKGFLEEEASAFTGVVKVVSIGIDTALLR